MSAVFLTATGTDIGKTFLTTALIRYFRDARAAVHAIKPVVTGFDQDTWETSDPAALLGALGQPVTLAEIERISPWQFKAPLAPDMAARQEGRAIAFCELVEFSRQAAALRGTVLIEGIG